MITALAIGVVAGILAGMFGVGGGLLIVPALAFLANFDHIDAEATSLLAIIPTAAVGAWRQHRYGNVRIGEGLLVGVLSAIGVVVGTIVANAASGREVELAFALLMFVVAGRLLLRAWRGNGEKAESPEEREQARDG